MTSFMVPTRSHHLTDEQLSKLSGDLAKRFHFDPVTAADPDPLFPSDVTSWYRMMAGIDCVTPERANMLREMVIFECRAKSLCSGGTT